MLLLGAPSKVLAQPTYENVAISHVSSYVNVRTQPNTHSEIVGKIYNDCAATILAAVDGEGGAWYQIQSGSVNGYIKAEYFITGSEAEKLAKSIGAVYVRINTASLRLREQPNLSSQTLTILSQDDEYVALQEEGDFVKIQVDASLSGFVHKDYIEQRVEFRQAVSLLEEQTQREEADERRQAAAAAIARVEEIKSGSFGPAGPASGNPDGMGSGSPSLWGSTLGPGGGQIRDKDGAGSYGPGMSGASQTEPYPPSGPGNGELSSALRTAVVAYAKQFVGNPYVYGGTSLTEGADCSGFTMKIYEHFGIDTGRSSRDQADKGKAVPIGDIEPGDLVFYANGGNIDHVAMYIGGGQIIHASTERTGIKISTMNYRTPCKAVTFLNEQTGE
jgi:cell wall-associated NlpC family hydrolase